jgi:2-amino-4-hydroxy-6-hydroxymethyldihydropteridine diphosphokinase
MALIYLGLGSNLGQKEEFINQAFIEIEKQIGFIKARSAFFSSEPWGFISSNNFLNACIAVETTLTPQRCLITIKEIERRLGRLKIVSEGYKDRVIDIDILFYDQIILHEDHLTIPHPLLHQRLFVLNPLSEIAPNLLHPVFNKTIDALRREIS